MTWNTSANRLLLVLAATILILLLPTPPNLSPQGQRALAAFTFAGTIFALQPVSLPFSSLMVSISLVFLDIADTSQAFQALSNPIIILILGSLFMAEALRKYGLTRRLAFNSIILSDGNVNLVLLGLMTIAAFLSMWMENTATAAVLIPVALTIANQVPDRKAAKELTTLLILGIAYSASLGGMVTITGSASNAVASGFLNQITDWSFLDWMKYGLIAFITVFPVTWLLLTYMMNITTKSLNIEIAREELKKMDHIDSKDWEILLVIILTATLWIIGPNLSTTLGLNSTALSPSIIAITAVAFLSIRGIIEWDDVKDVSWGMFFIIGAGLSLGDALTRTGATEWLSGFIEPLITEGHPLTVITFLVFSSALLTNIINNTTVAAVFAPILIRLGNINPNLNAIQLILPLTLATTFGYALPSASGRMALISATGLVDRKLMIRYGIILTFVSSSILSALFYLLTMGGLI
jgi:sodium-dependent dicarboxylate transporter 2/3/5